MYFLSSGERTEISLNQECIGVVGIIKLKKTKDYYETAESCTKDGDSPVTTNYCSFLFFVPSSMGYV